MKKLMIAMLVVVLTVPAAALAKQPPKPVKTTKQAQLVAKNSAQMCKALKAANPTTFASMFAGVNHNTRNAYGKCVSSHARTKTHTGRTITLKNITLNTTGTVSSATDTALASSGTIAGILGGTYTSTFTLGTTSTPNPAVTGATCVPATGTVTLTLPGLGTLTKTETGNLCQTQAPTATNTNVPREFTGTFTVASGTGVFNGATGSGTSTFAQQPGTTSAQGGAVTGSETFQSLTLKF